MKLTYNGGNYFSVMGTKKSLMVLLKAIYKDKDNLIKFIDPPYKNVFNRMMIEIKEKLENEIS